MYENYYYYYYETFNTLFAGRGEGVIKKVPRSGFLCLLKILKFSAQREEGT